MKSSKTDVLSFDELARFHGLSLMKWDEDNYASENTQLANNFFEAGQQSKQDEVDELKMSNHYLSVQVIDAEAYSEHWKYERDKLQKRIDEAWMWCEKGCVLKAMEILKGDQS